MKQLYIKTRDEWREWLSEHHNTESEVWLVFFKKETGRPSVEYECSVEEALCFGWIDSIIKKIDAEKYARKFTPRKPDSKWSKLNKKRVAKVMKEGRMTEHGLAKIEAAKKSGLWDQNDRPEVSLEMPDKLGKALAENKKAKSFFDQLAPSYQKQYILWIQVAQREETKDKRVEESIHLLEQGKKLGLR
jgi:uncharacterized protein YdeI (YjbR/CyaY-like superfamily)